MKNLVLSLLIIIVVAALSPSVFAQVGIGTETPSPRAVLELHSPGNNQGFLVPRLTTAERNAIASLGASEKGLLVFDTSVDRFYYWGGAAWVVIEDTSGSGTVTGINTGAGLTGGPITVSGTISLADNGVTTLKIADGAVGTADLANSSVTAAKLANTTVVAATYGSATQVPQFTVDAQGRITGVVLTTIAGVAPGGAAGGDLAGTYPNPTVANNAITTTKILDGTIATGDLADGSVTDAKVTTVAPAKLTAGGATTGQVLKWNGTNWTPQADAAGTGTVTNIATGPGLTGGPITATGTIALADGGVTTVKLADGGVTTAKILDGTIATGDLADGSVTDVKVTTVAPAKLTAGGATTGQVLKWNGTNWTPQADAGGSGTVTNIATGAGLTGGPITATGTIALADGGVTTVKLADGNVTTAKILDGTIATADLADGSVTTGKISDGTIATVDLANASVTAGKLANTAVTAGSYGTATEVSQITVDAQGRITSAANVTITGAAPTGAAGGDLTGNFPNPTIAANAVGSAEIIDATIATADLANASVTAGKLANTAVTAGSYGTATEVSQITVDAQGRITSAANVTITGAAPTGAAGGDLTGNFPNPTIAADAVGSSELIDASVATADLANASVTAAKLANTAVTAGSYGTATQVSQIVVDAQGRITGAVNTTIAGVAPGGAAGGDLTGTYPNPTVAANAISSAEITDGGVATADILDGTIATADLANASVTAGKLANTAVTAGSYGTATQVSQITVDGQGRITSAANVAITGVAPTGVAGGDLAGTYPNPTVAADAISSAEIIDGSVTTGDILDGTIATADLANASVTAGKLANTAVTVGSYGTGTQVSQITVDAQGRITSAANVAITGAAPTGAAGGDLTGTYPNPTVAANAISSAEITDGGVATADILDGTIATADLANASVTAAKLANTTVTAASYGTATQVPQITVDAQGRITGAVNTTIAGVAPGGAAGGDLTGTYPNPTVAANAISSAEITDGGVATADILDGTIATADLANASVTAGKLANTAVTAGSYGTATQVSQITVDAQGRITGAVNTTIAGVAPGGAAGGDLNGTYPNPTVDALQGRAVATTLPTDGQVLKWNGTATAWTPAADNSSGFTLPYFGSSSAASTLFEVTQDGATERAARFNVTNASNNSPALTTSTTGTGFSLVANGVNYGVGGGSTAQNGVAGYFVNSSDRGYGTLGYLNTTGTPSFGALGTTYLNDGVHFGVGVLGQGDDYGIRATGGGYGGEFLRTATDMRVLLAGSGTAVYASTGEDFGVGIGGYADGNSSTGINGQGTDIGVSGTHTAGTGTNPGVYGQTFSLSANASGVTGVVTSTDPGGSSSGVRGINNGTGGLGIGVYGFQAGTGWGIYGSTGNASGYAGWFSGRVNVTGVLSKGGGSFKIDHPLDPQNKYLYHSFVESPDMKNIYDGVVVLDARGEAEVVMADWFEALNKDFRYQLTSIGGHAPIYIASEVSNNRFRIAGGTPGMKVSWQVTGTRKDAFAEKNRIPVEEMKTGSERGKYLYPQAAGAPESMGVTYEIEQGARNDVRQIKKNEENTKKLIDSQKNANPKGSRPDSQAESLKALKSKVQP